MKRLALLFLLLASSAFAADNVIYLAVQQSGTPVNTTKWNSFNDPGTGTSLTNMHDEDGNATVFDFDIDSAAQEGVDGVNAVATGDAADLADEAIISLHYNFVNSETAVWTFSDLDDAKTYTFDFFCSRFGSGTRRVEVSFDAFVTAALGNLNCYGNSSEILTIASLSPSSGALTLHWRKVSGDAFGYMGSVRMTEDILVATNPLRRRRSN